MMMMMMMMMIMMMMMMKVIMMMKSESLDWHSPLTAPRILFNMHAHAQLFLQIMCATSGLRQYVA